MTDPNGTPDAHRPLGAESLRDTLAWVLRSLDDPATAAGDWIAYEVDDNRGTAVSLLRPVCKMVLIPGSYAPGAAARVFTAGATFRAQQTLR